MSDFIFSKPYTTGTVNLTLSPQQEGVNLADIPNFWDSAITSRYGGVHYYGSSTDNRIDCSFVYDEVHTAGKPSIKMVTGNADPITGGNKSRECNCYIPITNGNHLFWTCWMKLDANITPLQFSGARIGMDLYGYCAKDARYFAVSAQRGIGWDSGDGEENTQYVTSSGWEQRRLEFDIPPPPVGGYTVNVNDLDDNPSEPIPAITHAYLWTQVWGPLALYDRTAWFADAVCYVT